jgi:dimethylaniline monooxygenase (N-oxide forming)
MYEFPDKAFPASLQAEDVPAKDVVTYLEEFIQEQSIGECFRFGVEIRKITREADDRWTLYFADDTKETFSFVVVCTGLYSNKPNIIHLPGREAFEKGGGVVIHTSERKDDSEFKGKNVVVVGNGKSAVDAARAAGKVAKETGGLPPTQLVRNAKWYFPKYLMGMVHFKYAFLCRFGGAMLPRYYFDDSTLSRVVHALISPLKFLFWRMIEIMFIIQYRLPWHMIPKLGTINEEIMADTALAVTEEDLRSYRTGEVTQRVATIDRLEQRKVVLSNGNEVDCDVIVLGTGWKTGLDLLDDKTIKPLLDLDDDGLWLYRHILPPMAKGLAFVGSNASTFTNPNTAYIQACWLGDLLAGNRNWPSDDSMLENAEQEKVLKRALYRFGHQRGAAIFGFLQHYHDLLLRDMDIDPMRYGGFFGSFCNWMLPVVPSDLRGLLNPDCHQSAPKLRAPAPLHALAGIAIASLLFRIWVETHYETL